MSKQTGAWRPEERNAQRAWDDGVEINSQTQHSQSDEYQKHKENPKAARARKGLRVALPATQKEECRHCMTENGGLAL